MQYLKISIGVFLVLAFSRFIPHPPNFTSLIALSFYIPAAFGLRYIWVVLIAFFITDIVIGLHSTLLFTWGSVVLIGFISKYLNQSMTYRLIGALSGATIFFIISNFGVWSLGGYGYTLKGMISCYTLALPFFGYSAISTLFFSVIIEAVYGIYKNTLKNYFSNK